MKAFLAIYKRELMAYFHSPIAYVLMVGFLVITGYFFYTGVAFYSLASIQAMQNPMMMKLNLQDMLMAPLISNMSIILMLITPLLTMRLLAEEKRTGSIELLLAYPLSDACVVLAKFLSAWTIIALMLASTWVQVGMLAYLGPLHLPGLLTGYLGLLLMTGCFTALGVLASAATENQIVAAAASFAGLLILWMLGLSAQVTGPEIGQVLTDISLGAHFNNFTKGLIDTADLAYFILFMALFLFLSIRTLEAKRWKA